MFTRGFFHGDLDDIQFSRHIVYKKSPTTFWELLTALHGTRQKLILIEGSPGVGKTTFSWEFCRKWGRGEILQDHSLLLLLPLRDNNLKETTQT